MKDLHPSTENKLQDYRNQEKKDSLLAGVILGLVVVLICSSFVARNCQLKLRLKQAIFGREQTTATQY